VIRAAYRWPDTQQLITATTRTLWQYPELAYPSGGKHPPLKTNRQTTRDSAREPLLVRSRHASVSADADSGLRPAGNATAGLMEEVSVGVNHVREFDDRVDGRDVESGSRLHQGQPGCAHCYAETFAERFRGVDGHAYEQGFDLRLVPDKLPEPLRWTTPKLVFVNSMSELFHKEVPDDYIERVCRVMEAGNWHTYQVLTKRAERMADLLRGRLRFAAGLPHVWWGVSVENRRHGVPRIGHLQAAPAAVRWLSVEPLLEDLGVLDLTGIDWVVVGGESGPRARPIDPEWVLSLRDQCQRAGVPFFFKQWGGRNKKANGRTLDGRTYDEYPPRVAAAPPGRKARLALVEAVQDETLRLALQRTSLPLVDGE
jgi:protein gp37